MTATSPRLRRDSRHPHHSPTFATKLRARCAQVGITRQKDLYDRLGLDVSAATVSRWFSGKVIPDAYEATRIASVLGVTVEWLGSDAATGEFRHPVKPISEDLWWAIEAIGQETAFKILARAAGAALNRPPVHADPIPEPGTTYRDGAGCEIMVGMDATRLRVRHA